MAGGYGYGGGIVGGYLSAEGQLLQQQQQRQQIQAHQLALQQAARQKQAQGAYFNALTSPEEAALPQQGPPGMGPPPGAPPQLNVSDDPGASAGTPSPPIGGGMPMPRPPTMGPGGPQGSPGFQPPAMQASGPAPSGGPPQPGGGPPGGGMGQRPQFTAPDPVARLRQMAQRIKQANPGLDNATLASALEQQVALSKSMAPEDRALLQAETQIMRIQAQADAQLQRAQSSQQAAQIRADSAMQIAQLRIDAAQAARGPGGSVDITAKPTLSEAAGRMVAQRLVAGDSGALTGLGSGAVGAANRSYVYDLLVKDRPDLKGEDLAAARAMLQGDTAAARTTGVQASKIGIGGAELQEFGPELLEASKRVNRTQFPTVNALIESARRGTGDMDVIELGNWAQAVKSAYTQVMTRGGVQSVDSQKRADHILNTAWSQGQLERAVKVLQSEAASAIKAAEKQQSAVGDRIRGRAGPRDAAAGGQNQWPGAPPVDSVVNGYRYKGGDPNKQESYEEAKFQDGGSFTVAGKGGTDSQNVQFRASPGERVTITPEMSERYSPRSIFDTGNPMGYGAPIAPPMTGLDPMKLRANNDFLDQMGRLQDFSSLGAAPEIRQW